MVKVFMDALKTLNKGRQGLLVVLVSLKKRTDHLAVYYVELYAICSHWGRLRGQVQAQSQYWVKGQYF